MGYSQAEGENHINIITSETFSQNIDKKHKICMHGLPK